MIDYSNDETNFSYKCKLLLTLFFMVGLGVREGGRLRPLASEIFFPALP